ncbi:hypothetical protein VN0426_00350 [Helicobacter pylori]
MRISNLWILTEERPKDSALRAIIEKFALDNRIGIFISDFRIIPILDRCCGNFTFYYRVMGVCSHFIKNIYIRNVSGSSSFVDFLVFFKSLDLIHWLIFHFILLKKQKQMIVKVEILAFIKEPQNLFMHHLFSLMQEKLCSIRSKFLKKIHSPKQIFLAQDV